MYTIGAFRKKKDEPEAPPEPEFKQEPAQEETPPAPVLPQRKEWVILTKKNIVDESDEKTEDIKKNELLRVIRYNDREIILKKAYQKKQHFNSNHHLPHRDGIQATPRRPFSGEFLSSAQSRPRSNRKAPHTLALPLRCASLRNRDV